MNYRTPASTVVPRRRRHLAIGIALAIAVLGLIAAQWFRPVLSSSLAASTSMGGVVEEGEQLSVFDEQAPAVTKLDPDLLAAVRQAATDAAADNGITFQVTSGWRSPEYQEQLLKDAIDEYGSAEEAARWVATPETSAHVSGDAVDIGPYDAIDWLVRHGDSYGLCQIYGNESWHFELRPEAATQGCPPMYADPSEDPRLWQ
ncbi:M15 family metallopeptidase [Actinoalloteichus hymeniacidonis]|uniref:D-alanyl-D-alanine carboxypeptidase n=1 Tax=Actinoalloteichus hymeniacidonis TaxID=340345 RepID=A0AAC9HLR6_9PSEU|nr:M15 family metallopeptidase [Actinoalloteichus hymeniacidonis]AOS61511.1 D-alanyl-D-alanine carboxypeptidase [Actinoalloteichus hymeniacidonis]MBB5910481.1 preprotein translocase subunit Sec61beta [Actinoalloteichus hymeniacidonis]